MHPDPRCGFSRNISLNIASGGHCNSTGRQRLRVTSWAYELVRGQLVALMSDYRR
eukprot:gene153-3544_t